MPAAPAESVADPGIRLPPAAVTVTAPNETALVSVMEIRPPPPPAVFMWSPPSARMKPEPASDPDVSQMLPPAPPLEAGTRAPPLAVIQPSTIVTPVTVSLMAPPPAP